MTLCEREVGSSVKASTVTAGRNAKNLMGGPKWPA